MAAAIWAWLSGPKIVTRSLAVSLKGNLIEQLVLISISRMKMHFSP
jgi:hypothetical protein